MLYASIVSDIIIVDELSRSVDDSLRRGAD